MALSKEENKKLDILRSNIKTIRLLGRYTVREFSDLCYVSPQTITNWESKNNLMWKNYHCTIMVLLRIMNNNPPTDKFNKMVSYILLGYNDAEYKENLSKIEILAQAYKGGADDKTIDFLYSKLQLDLINEEYLYKDTDIYIPNILKHLVNKWLQQ